MEYKCPCCGGGIAFDSNVQKMKCPYCETEFEMETLKSFDDQINDTVGDDLNWDTNVGGQWQEGETDGLKTYGCESCGAEIVADETLAASKCPYCDNPIVMKQQFSGDLKPDVVIPFKLDKKAAKAKLIEHMSGKRLLPKVFKDQNHLDEVKGVYVPFWLFDTKADAQINYRATRIRRWSDSNYDYKETSYYLVRRAGHIAFEKIPVDGSTKMADDLMESIEPFDYKEAVPFQPAFLAGYLADRYDVDSNQSIDRANQRVKQCTEDAFASTVQGYDSVIPESTNIQLSDGKVKYALYPVWILNTTWNNEKFTFAMNGQTGKFVGNLPCDKGIAVKYMLGITAGLGVAFTVISRLVWMFL